MSIYTDLKQGGHMNPAHSSSNNHDPVVKGPRSYNPRVAERNNLKHKEYHRYE